MPSCCVLVFALAFSTLSSLFLSWILSTSLAQFDVYDPLACSLGAAAISVLVFLLTVRAFVAHDTLYQGVYEAGQMSLGSYVRRMLTRGVVWVDLAVCLACLLIAPAQHPLHAVLDLWQARGELSPSVLYGRVCLVSLPLYTALFLVAQLLARGTMRSALARQRSGSVKQRRPSRIPYTVRHMLRCVLPSLILLVVCAVLPLALNVLMLVAKVLGNTTVWIILACLVVYLAVFRYARAMLKRRKFCRDLMRVAQEAGSEAVFHHSVYRSLFFGTEGADFTLYHKGRRYDGKFLHSLRNYTPMLFDGSGVAELHRIYKIRHVELFRTVTTQRYEFSSDAQRVLVILPTPKKLWWVGGGARHDLDVGDQVGAYTIYNATGFLRAIERDCIGHREAHQR